METSLLKRDLTTDATTYNLTINNFDFGIRLDYLMRTYNPDVWENLDEYVSLRVSQNIYQWVYDANGFAISNRTKYLSNLVPCDTPRLGLVNDPNSTDFLGLRSSYLCPE